MSRTEMRRQLEFVRKKTIDMLDTIAKRPDAAKILAWRPGPGRAHIAWQLMHIAATDDRHLHVRMKGGEPQHPDLVRRFAGGSVPDDDIPSLSAIRQYLTEQRQQMLDHLRGLTEADILTK